MESGTQMEGRVDEALSLLAVKADIAKLRQMLRVLLALKVGIGLAILFMILGWLPLST